MSGDQPAYVLYPHSAHVLIVSTAFIVIVVDVPAFILIEVLSHPIDLCERMCYCATRLVNSPAPYRRLAAWHRARHGKRVASKEASACASGSVGGRGYT